MSGSATFIIIPTSEEILIHRLICQTVSRHYLDQQRVQLICHSKSQLILFDQLLWSFHPDAFIPHTLTENNFMQPPQVLLSDQPRGNINADIIVNCHEDPIEQAHQFRHIIEFVHDVSGDKPLRRQHFKHYQSMGMDIKSYQIDASQDLTITN